LPHACAELVDLFDNTTPLGSTPTIAALQGSYTYATSVQAEAGPGAETYVVLVTDGAPGFGVATSGGGIITAEGCTGNNFTTIATLTQSYANQGTKTYVLAMGAVANLDLIATAGGTALVGTGDATRLLAALNALPQPVFSCTQAIPPTAGVDPNQLNGFFTNSSSSDRQLIPNNPSCTRGDGSGWYVSGNDIVLCTPTCNQLKQDPSASLSVQFGCPTTFVAP
jgi:hypothetical protein